MERDTKRIRAGARVVGAPHLVCAAFGAVFIVLGSACGGEEDGAARRQADVKPKPGQTAETSPPRTPPKFPRWGLPPSGKVAGADIRQQSTASSARRLYYGAGPITCEAGINGPGTVQVEQPNITPTDPNVQQYVAWRPILQKYGTRGWYVTATGKWAWGQGYGYSPPVEYYAFDGTGGIAFQTWRVRPGSFRVLNQFYWYATQNVGEDSASAWSPLWYSNSQIVCRIR